MTTPEQFRELARRFREVDSRADFDSASQRAGQLAFIAIESGQITIPLEYPRPEYDYTNPNAEDQLNGMAWSTFCGIWSHENDNLRRNVYEIKLEKMGDGIHFGQSGSWKSIKHNYADVCDWISQQLKPADTKTDTGKNSGKKIPPKEVNEVIRYVRSQRDKIAEAKRPKAGLKQLVAEYLQSEVTSNAVIAMARQLQPSRHGWMLDIGQGTDK